MLCGVFPVRQILFARRPFPVAVAICVSGLQGSRLTSARRLATHVEDLSDNFDGSVSKVHGHDWHSERMQENASAVSGGALLQKAMIDPNEASKAKIMAALGVVAGEMCPTWRGKGGVSPGGSAAHSSETEKEVIGIGCSFGCMCSWNKQCYTRRVMLDEGNSVDVGSCDLSMFVLVVCATFLFLFSLVFVVVLRAVLIHTSTVAMVAGEHSPSTDILRGDASSEGTFLAKDAYHVPKFVEEPVPATSPSPPGKRAEGASSPRSRSSSGIMEGGTSKGTTAIAREPETPPEPEEESPCRSAPSQVDADSQVEAPSQQASATPLQTTQS